MGEPQIAKPNYNKTHFEAEKKNAKLLGEADIEYFKNLIKAEVKPQKKLNFLVLIYKMN